MASRKLNQVIERLLNEYGNEILRIAYVYLKDPYLAEDAVQEVFLKAFMNYNSFQHRSSERTWLTRITINVCKDMLRNNWHKKVDATEDAYLNTLEAEDLDFLEVVSNQELFEVILSLDDKYKDVIILYYYQGYKIAEIAAILETTTGTVSSLLSRARNQLKKLLMESR